MKKKRIRPAIALDRLRFSTYRRRVDWNRETGLAGSDYLGRWMVRRRIKQKHLAILLDVSHEQVSRWLWQRTRPPPEVQLVLERISRGEVPRQAWLWPEEDEYVNRICEELKLWITATQK